jgi:hypothetical protein
MPWWSASTWSPTAPAARSPGGPAVVARRSGTASTGASSARTWAGAVGAALTNRLFELGWIRRSEHDRAVHVTADGRDGFAEVFQVSAVPGAA